MPNTPTSPDGGTASAHAALAGPRPDFVVLRPEGERERSERLPSLRAVLVQLGAAALVVVAAVAVTGVLVSRRAAQSESVRDAARLTDVLAESVVQPALSDAMATSPAAAAGLERVVRDSVLSATLVRVKLWTPDGEILYSDEPRLVGRRFGLDADAREALAHPKVSADVSDLSEPENRYERGHGTLLEVHRPVWTPDGRPLLFETYFRYDEVRHRAAELWRGFAAITLGSIGVVVILLVPLGWTLVLRTRRAQRQRVAMMQHVVQASAEERRRIAATLHDGVVQDLVAASFAVSAAAQQTRTADDRALADRLDAAAASVRSTIGGMRSLLVDIYPPNLHDAGLPAALRDLCAGLHLDVDLAVDDAACSDLDRAGTEAVFHVAQETLRNVAAHARASSVAVTVRRDSAHAVLEVHDDGVGFDPSRRPAGHFGLSVIEDVARACGAELALRTAPGAGTTWRLRVPVGTDA